MLAILTICFDDSPAHRIQLNSGDVVTVGRSPSCDVVIDHPSVSGQHAQLVYRDGACQVIDLDSSNGSQLNGMPLLDEQFSQDALITFGGVECLVEFRDQDQVLAALAHNEWRRKQVEKPQQFLSLKDILSKRLTDLIAILGMHRGMILLGADPDHLVVAVSVNMNAEDFNINHFEGSYTAIQSSLAHRQPVFAMDVSKNAMLHQKGTVYQKNIASLVSTPFISDHDQVFGLIYIDSKEASKVLTTFDLELIETMAAQIQMNIRALNIETKVNDLIAALEDLAEMNDNSIDHLSQLMQLEGEQSKRIH